MDIMSKELEEILDRWKLYISLTKDFSNKDMELIKIEELEELLDYITNLQQENERLKNELVSKPDIEWELETKDGQKMTIIQSKRIDMQEALNKSLEEMCKQLDNYKSRCEKAIEYIEQLPFNDLTPLEVKVIYKILGDKE